MQIMFQISHKHTHKFLKGALTKLSLLFHVQAIWAKSMISSTSQMPFESQSFLQSITISEVMKFNLLLQGPMDAWMSQKIMLGCMWRKNLLAYILLIYILDDSSLSTFILVIHSQHTGLLSLNKRLLVSFWQDKSCWLSLTRCLDWGPEMLLRNPRQWFLDMGGTYPETVCF